MDCPMDNRSDWIRVSLLKVPFHIHAVMQDANNLYTFVTLPVENEVSSNVIFPLTWPDIVAGSSDSGLMSD